ncbi:MAG: 3'(2'),5'-bisphosphate nucleotidase CysQ [Rickettsiales bacterium]|nr:3'(2'),5'-bisphosphate nucleotidase CysQ [Rickettsiales bacterium]
MQVIDIAVKAGIITMDYYGTSPQVQLKADQSPVTAADLAANKHICDALITMDSSIPIVSEENNSEENQKIASHEDVFWLVDPLDGTKSFIKQSGQFTVNIALIQNKVPVMGVIYVPTDDCLYYNDEKQAYKVENYLSNPQKTSISVSTEVDEEGVVVIASKSHLNDDTKRYIESLNVKSRISASSSLKLCLVAEGKADIYPRFGPTMEWDIAAGHAILNAAGGTVVTADGEPLLYGKDTLYNPYFIASNGLVS